MLEGIVDNKANHLEMNPLAAFFLLKPHIFQSEIWFFEREKEFYQVIPSFKLLFKLLNTCSIRFKTFKVLFNKHLSFI